MDGSFISSHTALKDISRRATTEAPQEPTCTRCSCPRDGRDGQPGSTGELTSVSGWRDKGRLSIVAFHQFLQLIMITFGQHCMYICIQLVNNICTMDIHAGNQ